LPEQLAEVVTFIGRQRWNPLPELGAQFADASVETPVVNRQLIQECLREVTHRLVVGVDRAPIGLSTVDDDLELGVVQERDDIRANVGLEPVPVDTRC
jgi:hypothetical protein